MMVLEGPPALIGCVAFSSDSNLLAAGTQNGEARLWDSAGTLMHSWETQSAGSKCAVAFQPNQATLAVSAENKLMLHSLDAATPGILQPHRTPGVSTDLAFLTLELLVVATGKRGGASAGGYYLYDCKTRQVRSPVQNEAHGVRAISVHAPSKSIAWATGMNLLRWATITKPGYQEVRMGHSAASIAIHPASGTIAAAVDWKIRTFDMPSRTERLSLNGHKGQVTAVAYHPNGRSLASGSWDETVRIWDLANGREISCLQWKIGKILCLSYSPDGTRLAAGSDRGLIAIWDLD